MLRITALALPLLACAAPLVARSRTTMRAPLGARRSRNMAARSEDPAAVQPMEVTPVAPVQTEAPMKQLYKYATGTAPMGNYWDPLGLSKDKSESEMKRIREAEITHSRVAMLAFLGFLFQEALIDRPLFSTPELGPITGPAIYHFQEVAERFPFFWLATIPFIAMAEHKRALLGWQDPTKGGSMFGLKDDYIPGNLGFDPTGAYPADAKGRQEMQNKELNNGRLAMLGVAGLMAQELISGKTMYDGLNLGSYMPPHGPY